MKAILSIKLTAYHRPISICFVGKKLFLIFNKMFTISPWSPNGLPSLFPLSLWERVGVRGMSASSANPTAGLTQQSLTNRLSLLRFLSTHSSHVSICSLKIAKRQSISRGSVMAAISDTAKVNSSGPGAETQGR